MGDDYLPLVEGAEWTFSVDDAARDSPLGEKSNKIVERVGNVVKFANTGSTKPGFRWLEWDGERYAWLRNVYSDAAGQPETDQYYEPPALRFDATQTSPDATWTEPAYTKTTIDIAKCPSWSEALGKANLIQCPVQAVTSERVEETWRVIAADSELSAIRGELEPEHESEAVPAGDFTVLCHERTCEAEACITGTYCFTRGVGKVFELSAEREQLKSFCAPEAP